MKHPHNLQWNKTSSKLESGQEYKYQDTDLGEKL